MLNLDQRAVGTDNVNTIIPERDLDRRTVRAVDFL